MKKQNFLLQLIQSYIFVLGIAFVFGLVFSKQVDVLADYSTIFLGIIFFFSALKIDLKEVTRYFKDEMMVATVVFAMLFVFPIAAYYITNALVPELAIAFMLLAAMPTGMTAPLLAEISGGKQSLALVMTVATSLLAPITIPFITKFLVGETVEVDVLAMFWSLAKIVFIPFLLANFIKHFWETNIKATYYTFKPISIALLGLLIMGIIAKQADQIIDSFQGRFFWYLFLLFIFFIILHIVGYFIVFWRSTIERLTIDVTLTYMNFTLAIYLAGTFFNEPNVVVPVILAIIPWSILIIPFKYIIKGLTKKPH